MADAVRDLLALAGEAGLGLSFEPLADGWAVGYINRVGGGDLAYGDDLDAACAEAREPLRAEIAHRSERGV